jgi:lipopolysaccharide biosynthesis regulator YciM
MGTIQAQNIRGPLRDGNRSYKKDHFDEAERHYRRAAEIDSMDYRALFNLGNALYRQKKYDQAALSFDKALQRPDVSDPQRAHALHNLGNSYLKAGMDDRNQAMQLFQQAVQSYQEALKLDPKNDDTRYNLAYARRLLQQSQQQQNQQGQGQGQNQQNQNQQNQNQQNQNQQNKDQQNKNQSKQNQQNQNNKDQQNQQNQNNQQNQKNDNQNQKKNQGQRPDKKEQKKKDAERMLEAVKNNERQTLKDQAKKVQAASEYHSDKDW